MDAFSDEKAKARNERMRRLGFGDMSELVYRGRAQPRHRVPHRRWLACHASSIPDLYAANGFTLPDGETMAAFGDVKYLSASLA